MTTLTATAARKDLFDLVKNVTNKHEVYHIHHRSGDAVLLSEKDYDSLVETLELLSIPGFRESMKKSISQMNKDQTMSFDEVLGDIG
ncbi:MAG: type II toxin-antitoxin system Phd/YefM family antitoxin [Spartobacteria bacterium]|nr:type II toxin-antitoxin system Phd/YefM family antitoxin [Spartobacteria bacterium]